MGQLNIATQGKTTMEDAEAANTATQQNKTNTQTAVDPKVDISIKGLKDTKQEMVRNFRCFLCLFLALTIVFGGFLIFVHVNLTRMGFADFPVIVGGDSLTEGSTLFAKNWEDLDSKYRELQKSYEDLKSDLRDQVGYYENCKMRSYMCERATMQLMAALSRSVERCPPDAKDSANQSVNTFRRIADLTIERSKKNIENKPLENENLIAVAIGYENKNTAEETLEVTEE